MVVEAGELAGHTDDAGKALGVVDSLEVAWDPPAATAPVGDTVRTADWEITYEISDTFLDTLAMVRLRRGRGSGGW